jgi:uncharacterized membrane protein
VSDRAVRAALALVALTGLALAAYLTWVHYDENLLVCTAGGGCETVQQSSYAELAGVPVAVLGVVFYASVLALVAWDAPVARTTCAGIAVGGLAFAAYLVALQLFVIDALCAWCLLNDLVLVPALAVLAVIRARRATSSELDEAASA